MIKKRKLKKRFTQGVEDVAKFQAFADNLIENPQNNYPHLPEIADRIARSSEIRKKIREEAELRDLRRRADHGTKFVTGRKRGAEGLLKRTLRRLLLKQYSNEQVRPAQVWLDLQARPLKGIQVNGKPNANQAHIWLDSESRAVEYKTFSNILRALRKELRTKKLSP